MEKRKIQEKELENWLFNHADKTYQAFVKKLLPGTENILGVRLPELRKLAKEILKGEWKVFLEEGEEIYFEQVMLKGMIIGNLKIEFEEWIRYIDQFVPKITNWSICDSFCSGLKMTKKYPEKMWEFIKKYAEKEEEFSARFGFVMMLNYFIEENYLEEILGLLENIKSEAYYVKMAAAWVISVCYAKYPERTIKFLEKGKLDRQIFQKALQKILESNRVKEEQKIRIREMKKEKRDF